MVSADTSSKGKNASVPLPSILSNIRNAGRSSALYQQNNNGQTEMQPLMIDGSEARSSTHTIHRSNSVNQMFEKFQSMEVFKRSKQRVRRLRQRHRVRGFQVDLPPKFLVYTIMVFIILPLLMGSFFLARTVIFGSLKEDEEHPLHKKMPRIRKPISEQSQNQTSGLENIVNATSPPIGTGIISDEGQKQGAAATSETKDVEPQLPAQSSTNEKKYDPNPPENQTLDGPNVEGTDAGKSYAQEKAAIEENPNSGSSSSSILEQTTSSEAGSVEKNAEASNSAQNSIDVSTMGVTNDVNVNAGGAE